MRRPSGSTRRVGGRPALAETPDEVSRSRAGEERAFEVFAGQPTRRANKSCDPEAVQPSVSGWRVTWGHSI